jgi:hypothetical protein
MELLTVALGFSPSNDICCANQDIDNISCQGHNPSTLDRDIHDFWSMIDAV